VEIVERARELVGADYPVMVKMNCDDFMPGGLVAEEAQIIAKIAVKAGVDCVEVTGGVSENLNLIRNLGRMMVKGPNKEKREAYFRSQSLAIKEAVDVPIILVGGMRTTRVMEDIIEKEIADFIAMSRPLIREPGLVTRWQSGDVSGAKCITCGQCSQNLFIHPLKCHANSPDRK